ncbi:MFS general substrate transporter [Lophiostoma macrostomum CBS 122681]|uniref:MFS general substrate transporter n=1 Tax=Lophiostoma macrostomum CBS 122681 TaxID=1314788 RepID=A0A6A6TNE8_9PLEO|nr:MFS general substrate transporter [Lophiostoma macrostomum CBS 122681]
MVSSMKDYSPTSPFASQSSWKLDEAGHSNYSLHQYNGNYDDVLDLIRAERASRNFIDFNGPQDRSNPFNWPISKKWRVTLLVCFMTLAVQINGTEMTSAAEHINESFRVSDEKFPHSYWPVLSWNLGGAAAPMLALPLMERFGVRWSYFSIYVFLIIFLIPQALAQNFATLIVTRIITGACSGVLANVTSSVVSDIWREGRSKSFATSLWIWSLLAGLSTGPVLGSVTLKYVSWRWIFLSEIILYSALLPILFLALPEVRSDVILTQNAKRIRAKTGKPVYARTEKSHTSFSAILADTLVRPARMLITEPVVLFFGFWSAFCIGTAFMFTQSIVQVYGGLYEWGYFPTGIVQIAVVVGEAVGLLASIYQDELYFRSGDKNHEIPGKPIPEARLYLSIPGSFVGLTGGLFFYAWTSEPTLPWYLPTIGLGFVGFGMFTVVTAVTGYILDCYAKYTGSAIAGVAFLENIFAAFLPLATQSLYRDLGFSWASSLLGFLALALSFIPLVLQAKGKTIRAKSKFIALAGYEET